MHPTIFLLLWFLIGFALERLWPLPLPGAGALDPVKIVALVVGGVLFVWSALELRRHQTTMDHGHPTTALVTGGPYRLSRHPIYVAMTLILIGMAIEAASLWFVFLTVAFWGALQYFTVRSEEAYLEREFGAEYEQYRDSVRQWI